MARKTTKWNVFCKFKDCPRSSKPFRNNYDLKLHEATNHDMHQEWYAERKSKVKRWRDYPKCRMTDCSGNGVVFKKAEWKQHCSDNPEFHGPDTLGRSGMIKSQLEQYIKANPNIYHNTPCPESLHIKIPQNIDEFEVERDEKEESEEDESAEMLDLDDNRVLSRNAARYFLEGNNIEIAESGGNPCRGPATSGQTKCPHNVVTSVRTSLFYAQEGKFYLNSRCVRCYALSSREGQQKIFNRPREPDGTQLCRLQLSCTNVDAGYRAGCRSCIRKKTEGPRASDINSKVKKDIRIGRGYNISNPSEMARYLQDTRFPKPRHFDELHELLRPTDELSGAYTQVNNCGELIKTVGHSFALDTEWVRVGRYGTFALSICVMRLPEKKIVVNHRLKLPIPERDLGELCIACPGRFKKYCHFAKHYRDGGNCYHLPIVDGDGLCQLLSEAGFSPTSKMIEWSTWWCDWHILHSYLETYNKQDIMPPKENCLRVYFTWLDLLPGFLSLKLFDIARYVLGNEYHDNAHCPDSDTINLVAMTEKAISLRVR